MNNENGLTLIEVLLTFVLTLIIGSLVFSVLMSSIQNYKASNLQSDTLSEINQFVIKITDIYHQQTHDTFTIERIASSQYAITSGDELLYSFQGNSGGTYDVYLSSELWNNESKFSYDDPEFQEYKLLIGDSFQINKQNDYDLFIRVSHPESQRFNPIEFTSSLYKLSAHGSGDK